MYSDKSVMTLAKNLLSLLLPPTLESSSQVSESEAPGRLTSSVVEHAIKAVAERVNYGITGDMEKPPAGLCVWRWEVRNKDWLPKSMTDKVWQRFHERVAVGSTRHSSFGAVIHELVQAKKHLQSIFDALAEDEKDAILQHGKNNKSSKGKEVAADPLSTDDRDPNISREKAMREVCFIILKIEN